MKPLIGITMGDPAGVGPEILLRFSHQFRSYRKADLIVFGDASYLSRLSHRLFGSKRKMSLAVIDLKNLKDQAPIFGKATAWGGRASGEYVEAATRAALADAIDAVVTLPINKQAFNMGGWGKFFPDHTQMLASLTKSRRTVLMLVHGSFRVSHVTQHIPLRKVAGKITPISVRETIELTEKSLRDFGIRKPRIGVCGLNPHAGDGGVLGMEDKRIIAPVVKRLQKKGFKVEGPISADMLWPRLRAGEFDAGVAMYHDQGQIPVKLLATTSHGKQLDPGGVNVTLGLPFVRTSVAHGTAYDIAGKGKISARSFFEALDMAVNMVKRRKS